MNTKSNNLAFKFMLIFSFVMPALLLNSVGIVILNLVNHMHVTEQSASWLEAFKDGSIILGAFVLASFIPSVGYKKSLILGILCETIGCLLMWLFPSFLMSHIFFVLCGIGFALIKTTVYSTAGLMTDDPNQHASLISMFEGFFMFGVLGGFWIYGFFMEYTNWTITFIFLGIICIINLFVVLITRFDESSIKTESSVKPKDQIKYDMVNMVKLFKVFLVWFFVILAFSYVFIEQGITTWLPTYNNHVLNITSSMSVKIASLFALALAVGRIVGAFIMKKIKWLYVLLAGLVIAFILLVISIYLSHEFAKSDLTRIYINNWSQLPLVAYLIPIVGFFIAPIYPTICSSILSRQSKRSQSAMAGLILFFSALGGTIGSRIVGTLFGIFGGITAITAPLVPMVVLFIILIPYYIKLQQKNTNQLK